ncbi:ubiquitin carboxyl-terminal hydrolase isozyme L3 isoform X2 [Agrilus planipennis]|nr:ubiquitin carboxyl-terminal hydrolase isozyme L3 isoform X2 [Agrilus planipennis]
MNKFMQTLGVEDKWSFVDVYGLDGETLQWVPRPVLAVMLLFPCNDKFEEFAKEECEQIKQKGQTISPTVYFMKQFVSNACGTVALIHSIANNLDKINISDGLFKSTLESSINMTPDERGTLLTNTGGGISEIADSLAKEGQTEVSPNMRVYHHFVAFVCKDGSLYELDGRRDFPINRGPSSPEKLLEDAAKICKEYIEREPNEVSFTVMALAASEK